MTSPGDIIFRRSSTRTTSNSDASNDDMWDDKVLIDVYDRAINVAQEEVAKRLAMSTNSPKDPSAKLHKKKQKMQNGRKDKWQVGSKCRAVYSEDGLEYEATLIKLNGDVCTVSFIGYMNEEEVNVETLKPSAGERARMSQYFQSQNELDSFKDPTVEADSEWELSENTNLKPEIENYLKKTKKKQPKALPNRKNTSFNLPPLDSLPFNSFPFNMNLDNGDMPLPPPPPILPPMNGSTSQEDQALSTMLISWYMSGYYTGLYQGQKIAKRTQMK